MKNTTIRAFMLVISILSSSLAHAQSSSKGISFQGVIKTPSGEFPNISGTSVLVKILSPNNCILREESFSGVNITNGYLNLVIGRGTPTASNPNPPRDLNSVMNNSINLTGLTCLNTDGSINGVTTTYSPQSSDVRKLRISMQIDNDAINADFNMRAVAYAVNAESLNGKSDNSFINVNSVDGLTQNNVESIFQRYTQLNNILNGSFTGNVSGNVSGTAGNVTGVVAVANGGTGANSAAAARANLGIKGLALIDLPSPVDTSKFLRGDGTWASVVGGVSSVAGRNGAVVITTADLADFNAAADVRATGVVNGLKGQVNGLASLDAGGKVPSTQLALTSADIPNIDAAKVNSGTLTVNVNSTSVNAGTGQFTQLRVNDGAGKVLTMNRQAGGADYTIQWPANVGAAGSVLQTDATGILSWVAIPSAPVTSVAGKTGAVTLVKDDISGLGTAAALNAGTSADNLVQLDANAKIPASLLPNTVLTNSTAAGGDLSGTYPNPSIANNVITSSKIADGAVGALSKVVSTPGSAGTNRLLATDTGTGTTIKDFYCTTIGHYLKWTGTTGFGCAAISSADIADATDANSANTIVKRDPSGNFSAGTVTANLNGNVTGNVTGKLTGTVQTTIASKTANYNIQDSDGIITANASSGGLNFTLPSAVGIAGRQYTIKKVDSSANAVTLSTTASQTIDGSATAQISSQWAYMTVTSDGANWIVTNSTGSSVTAAIQFSFNNITDAAPNSLITSSAVTTTGSGTLSVAVSGSGNPQISINGGSWVTSGPITAGQTLAVRMTSSSSASTAQTATITSGSYSANWSVTTAVQLTSSGCTSSGGTWGVSLVPSGACDWVYSTPGTYSWTVPPGVFNVSVVVVGAGGGGVRNGASGNAFAGGNSSFGTVTAYGGGGGLNNGTTTTLGGGFVGADGGGNGGNSPAGNGNTQGGGGAGGYTGNGGNGGLGDGSTNVVQAATAGTGGAGGGGQWAGGGGVGIYGAGTSGAGGGQVTGGGGGSGGAAGYTYSQYPSNGGLANKGGQYGGGGGSTYAGGGGGGGLAWKNSISVTPGSTVNVVVGAGGMPNIQWDYGGQGGGGAVRIIWGSGRAFPSTLTAAP